MVERRGAGEAKSGRAWMMCVLSTLGAVASSPHRVVAGELGRASREITASSATAPQLLAGGAADVIVRIVGGAVCSGTPIANTRYVVTAAHCVLDRDGEVGARTVLRGEATYDAVAVLVDTAYHDHPSERLDAAVLVMDRVIPGAAARLAAELPTQGIVTLAGYQPIDTDGTLLRGSNPHNRPLPAQKSGPVFEIRSVPTGCVERAADLDVSAARVIVHCGLIPGSSGGGLFASTAEGLTLVGIISTVAWDLSANGVVPLPSLHQLLQHADIYTHHVSDHASDGSRTNIVRS